MFKKSRKLYISKYIIKQIGKFHFINKSNKIQPKQPIFQKKAKKKLDLDDKTWKQKKKKKT